MKHLRVFVEISRWLTSPLRFRRAAAIRVLGAQARLIPDSDVEDIVQLLVIDAENAWTSPRIGPSPERDAIRVIATLGDRIPETIVDQLMNLGAPARLKETFLGHEIANLFIQVYWAVPSRRPDISVAIVEMLRLPRPPHNLWDLVQNIPKTARQPLHATVEEMAIEGNREAIETLARWGEVEQIGSSNREASLRNVIAQTRGCRSLLFCYRHAGGSYGTAVNCTIAGRARGCGRSDNADIRAMPIGWRSIYVLDSSRRRRVLQNKAQLRKMRHENALVEKYRLGR